jgi:hypothetical protein
LPQFQLGTLADRMSDIVLKIRHMEKKKQLSDHDLLRRMKSRYFISAEGAYSSLIFNTYHANPDSAYHVPNNKNRYKVLIAGRMMSDKITKPVIWKVFPPLTHTPHPHLSALLS